MRRILLFALPLAAIAALSSCEKNPGGLSGDDVIRFQDHDFLNALLETEEVDLIIPGSVYIDESGCLDYETETDTMDVDQNRDGQITVNEAKPVRGLYIDLDGEETVNVDEIKYFTNIETLELSFDRMSSLDLSNNTALTYADIMGGELESINLSKNTELIVLALETFNLTSLDLSNNSELRMLYFYDAGLTSLDLSNNTKLASLSCSHNQFTSLDISNNTELRELYCDYNQLTSLDISNNTELRFLYCYYNQLTSLDISNNTELTELDCSHNQLTSLDISNNTKLSWLVCDYNPLKSITVSASQLNTEWLSDVLDIFNDIEVIVK